MQIYVYVFFNSCIIHPLTVRNKIHQRNNQKPENQQALLQPPFCCMQHLPYEMLMFFRFLSIKSVSNKKARHLVIFLITIITVGGHHCSTHHGIREEFVVSIIAWKVSDWPMDPWPHGAQETRKARGINNECHKRLIQEKKLWKFLGFETRWTKIHEGMNDQNYSWDKFMKENNDDDFTWCWLSGDDSYDGLMVPMVHGICSSMDVDFDFCRISSGIIISCRLSCSFPKFPPEISGRGAIPHCDWASSIPASLAIGHQNRPTLPPRPWPGLPIPDGPLDFAAFRFRGSFSSTGVSTFFLGGTSWKKPTTERFLGCFQAHLGSGMQVN